MSLKQFKYHLKKGYTFNDKQRKAINFSLLQIMVFVLLILISFFLVYLKISKKDTDMLTLFISLFVVVGYIFIVLATIKKTFIEKYIYSQAWRGYSKNYYIPLAERNFIDSKRPFLLYLHGIVFILSYTGLLLLYMLILIGMD